ncbi:MAG: hypothetical protein Q9211_001618, partial [Gyalolechia sp. 1 TL-2023]
TFDSLVVELMTSAQVEVSEVARRYDCAIGKRVDLWVCSLQQKSKSFVVDIAVGDHQPFQSVALEQIPNEGLIVPTSGLACFEFLQFRARLDDAMQSLRVQLTTPGHIETF